MKNMCFLFMIFVSVAHAGDRIGNGGDGVFVGDQVHLLDLFETESHLLANWEKISSNLNLKKQIAANEEKWIQLSFGNQVPSQELAMVLAIVRQHDAVFADMVIAAIRSHRWTFVDAELGNAKDEWTYLENKKVKLVQLALRDWLNVRIARGPFEKMQGFEKAALILHEAIYILADAKDRKRDNSRAIREVVSLMFSNLPLNISKAHLNRIGSDWLPLASLLNSKTASRSYVFPTQTGYYIMGSFFMMVENNKKYIISEPPEAGSIVTDFAQNICVVGRIYPLVVISYGYETSIVFEEGVPYFHWKTLQKDWQSEHLNASFSSLFVRLSKCLDIAKNTYWELLNKSYALFNQQRIYLQSVDQ